MSFNAGNKRKFNSGGSGGNKGSRTPRSHNKDIKKENKFPKTESNISKPTEDAPVHTPLSSDPNEWFRRLQPAQMLKRAPVKHTVSVAFPSSIVRYAQTRELKTYLVGQIARACSMHEIDEIIIFVDSPTELLNDPEKGPAVFICKLLQYLEAPSYLRKDMFAVNYHLKYAGLLAPLDMPHHMRRDDISLYREGVVVESQMGDDHSLVNIGLNTEALIDYSLQPGVRVTVKLTDLEKNKKDTNTATDSTADANKASSKYIQAEAVAPNTPRSEHGLYWGYNVRLAKTFSAVFNESPYMEEYENSGDAEEESKHKLEEAAKAAAGGEDGGDLDFGFVNPDLVNKKATTTGTTTRNNKPKGYDLMIGYSEKGSLALDEPTFKLKNNFGHMLIVFGGMTGIEGCVEADESMPHGINGRNAHTMFDYWLNTCPSLGSRVTRTEEAALVTLARLRPLITKATTSNKK